MNTAQNTPAITETTGPHSRQADPTTMILIDGAPVIEIPNSDIGYAGGAREFLVNWRRAMSAAMAERIDARANAELHADSATDLFGDPVGDTTRWDRRTQEHARQLRAINAAGIR